MRSIPTEKGGIGLLAEERRIACGLDFARHAGTLLSGIQRLCGRGKQPRP